MDADPITAFLAAMEATGIKPIEPIASLLGPKLCRFRCDGDGKRKRNGWRYRWWRAPRHWRPPHAVRPPNWRGKSPARVG